MFQMAPTAHRDQLADSYLPYNVSRTLLLQTLHSYIKLPPVQLN